MRRTMRLFSIAIALLMGGLYLSSAPQASAQRRRVIIVEPFPHYYYGPAVPALVFQVSARRFIFILIFWRG